MAVTSKKLTDAVCRDADPYTITRDTKIGGFYLKCGKRAKAFIYQHDTYNGVRKTIHHVIGRYDKGVTCEAARKAADDLVKEPTRLLREGMTFEEAIKLHTATARAPATVARYEQMERTGYLKDWMDRPLRSITRPECFDRHQALAKEVVDGKYAKRNRSKREDGKATADNVMRWFRSVWNRAMLADETLLVCPTINVTWHAVEAERTAIPSAKLAKWYEGVQALTNPVRRDYLLFVLFSGLRRRSAAEIRWSDVNLSERVLRIPNPKGGKKRAFDLPLPDQLVALLKERKANNTLLADRQEIPADALEWVFPAYSESGHIAEPRTDVPGVKFSIHDLRRTFVTVAATLSLSPFVIGALVNHSQPKGSVTAGYVQLEIGDLREPMQKIADKLGKLLVPSA